MDRTSERCRNLYTDSRLSMAVILLFLFVPVFGQEEASDLLVKRDGAILEVKILENKPDEILYRKKDDATGPVYSIAKSELLSAKYANGETMTFTITIDSFYENKTSQAPVAESSQNPRYRPLPAKNDFQKQVLSLPSNRLEHEYKLHRAGAKAGKRLGFAGTAIHIGVNLIGTIIIASNSDTDPFGVTYSTNPSASRAGTVMILGGTAAGAIMGNIGFIRAAKNGNKAKYIRGEMRRRGVALKSGR